MRIIQAGKLQSGDVMNLKIGERTVDRVVRYPRLTADQKWDMLDVFFVGMHYPFYYREDVEVEVR